MSLSPTRIHVMMLRRRTRLIMHELICVKKYPYVVKDGTYIDPNVNTTLKITFCRSSRVNFQTIGIGRARIIKSAVVRCQSTDLCEVMANVHTRNVHHAIANIESFLIDAMCGPDTHIPGVVSKSFWYTTFGGTHQFARMGKRANKLEKTAATLYPTVQNTQAHHNILKLLMGKRRR